MASLRVVPAPVLLPCGTLAIGPGVGLLWRGALGATGLGLEVGPKDADARGLGAALGEVDEGDAEEKAPKRLPPLPPALLWLPEADVEGVLALAADEPDENEPNRLCLLLPEELLEPAWLLELLLLP